MKKKNGFTLIEIMLSVAIIAILGGIVAMLMNAIVESWQYTSNRLYLQKASSNIMNELMEGGFEANGIRDAVDFIACGTDSMTFLPLWVDDTHKADPVANKAQKFTLNRQFKAGASIPLAQIKKIDSSDWAAVPVKFAYGEKNDSEHLDDVVQVLDPIPYGATVKFTFTPNPAAFPETQKSFTWNNQDRHIYLSYKDETRDILKTMPDIKVEALRFIYYDNLNQEIPLTAGAYLGSEQIRRTTAVKVYMLLTRKSDWREAVSFTNVRNAQGVGVSIMEGSVVPLPSSRRIKAFSIGNFFQRKKEGIIRLIIKPQNYKEWALQMRIIPDPSGTDRMKLEKFQIEIPVGRVVCSQFINQTFMNMEFINLLTLDRTGLYDYDNDNVGDFYMCEEDPVFVTVEELDFDGASLFVRP